MTDHIKIRALSGKWSIRAAGAVIAETCGALELTEQGYNPVIYFPRDDIAMAFLDQTEKTSHCPHKGMPVISRSLPKMGQLKTSLGAMRRRKKQWPKSRDIWHST